MLRFGLLLGAAAIIVALFGFLRSPLASPLINFRRFFEQKINNALHDEAIRSLQEENARLQSEIFTLKPKGEVVTDSKYHYIEAPMYSQFPFNTRSIVVLSRGSIDGVRVGMPVVTKDKVIFGKVKSVTRTESEVLTLFDASWKSAVFLGSSKNKAIIIGSTSPLVDFISEDINSSSGVVVLNASPGFPYGMLFGRIGDLVPQSGSALYRAELIVPYSLDTLQSVLVITDFP